MVIIHMQSRCNLPRLDGGHWHPCPSCYELRPCSAFCTKEPDVTHAYGKPCGAYAECDECDSRKAKR